MKVLMLTWEFPPFIAGGLGMACYGLAKALLQMGVHIDLLLPSTEDVFFPLRSPEDADTLPMRYLGQECVKETLYGTRKDLVKRLLSVGVSDRPETYLSFTDNIETLFDEVRFRNVEIGTLITVVREHLGGNEPLFKKVKEFAGRAVRHAGQFSCDVIHAHDWLTYPAAIMLKNMLKKPLVSHIHATEFDRAGGPGDGRIHNIEYAGLSISDLVVAVSQYTSRIVIDRYRIDPRKIRIVHNAYSLSESSNVEKSKIFKDPLVLFMGRITLQKGPDYFIEIAESVLRKHPKVRFIVAGFGDMYSKVLKSSAVKRLKDRVLFTGFLGRRHVERILAATDIFVLPSVSEPFGIVPLEAMAYGAVAIISKQSGVAEVVENVYKVDFWDVKKMAGIIVDLLCDPKKMKAMAKAGQEEALAMGWTGAAEDLVTAYKELI